MSDNHSIRPTSASAKKRADIQFCFIFPLNSIYVIALSLNCSSEKPVRLLSFLWLCTFKQHPKLWKFSADTNIVH